MREQVGRKVIRKRYAQVEQKNERQPGLREKNLETIMNGVVVLIVPEYNGNSFMANRLVNAMTYFTRFCVNMKVISLIGCLVEQNRAIFAQ